MFQSSLMSWSSQSIETETVENSQRISGSLPGLLVEPGVLLEVGHLLAGRRLGAAPLADPLAGPRRALVDVDLVAEQEEQLGPARRARRGPSAGRARGARRPRGRLRGSSLARV